MNWTNRREKLRNNPSARIVRVTLTTNGEAEKIRRTEMHNAELQGHAATGISTLPTAPLKAIYQPNVRVAGNEWFDLRRQANGCFMVEVRYLGGVESAFNLGFDDAKNIIRMMSGLVRLV